MKLKKLILLTAVLFTAILCLPLSACGKPMKSHVQELNYSESVAKINNPDQGFYRPIYVRLTDDGATYNQNIVTCVTQLYHLRIDISAFSAAVNGEADKPISQAALDGLDSLLTYLKSRDKNAVVRFAYDPSYGGKANQEPAKQMILQHIKQVSPILNNYGGTITAIEAGLIGPWGEMHTSTIANAEHTSAIIEAFLTRTSNIPVLVRTPKMIYNYLGITINDIENYTIPAKAYRLGLYNDGYLGSNSDLGTYSNREKEIEFLSKQTEHLPYGGEVVIPDSPLHNIEVCLPEMNKIHLNYLNIEWNNNVIDKWKNSTYTKECGTDTIYYGKTAFEYIENHMGYRFVLKKSTFKYSDKLDKMQIEIELQNVGFGNLNKAKHARLLFVNENGETVFTKNVGEFSGSANLEYST
ncbi:MAG: DUF4832 domain-containing protein, partial [Clostridia bacterium]|nr:DUF4832 domain-containing protein [Clostridia bacterium]